MARGKARKTEVKSDSWKFKGFINHEFKAEEIKAMLIWFDTRTLDVEDIIEDYVSNGYKVSISMDEWSSVYLFSATAKKTGTPLDGWIVQVKHSNIHRLLCAAAYMLGEIIPNGGLEVGVEEDDKYSW